MGRFWPVQPQHVTPVVRQDPSPTPVLWRCQESPESTSLHYSFNFSTGQNSLKTSEKNKERLSTPGPSQEEEAGGPFSAGLLERGARGRGAPKIGRGHVGSGHTGGGWEEKGPGLCRFGLESCTLVPRLITTFFYILWFRHRGSRRDRPRASMRRGTWCPGHVARLPHQAIPPPPARKGIRLEIAHSSGQEGGSLADRECWNWGGSGSGVKWGSAVHWAGLWEEGVQEVMALGAAMVLHS